MARKTNRKRPSNAKWLVLGGIVVAAAIGATIMFEQTKARNPDTFSVDVGGAKLELIMIQAGEFEMGSPNNEPGHDPSESPTHTVKIEQPFYIGKFEVTQAQWQAVIASNQSEFKGDPNAPADSIARRDAIKFCQYATQRTTRVFRLPTEAEWEYACRAGTSTAFSGGTTLTTKEATFKSSGGDKPLRTKPVGSHAPNAWGLYDMHGNVYEWCADMYRADYKDAPTDGTAVLPPKAAPGDVEGDISYIYRGGSWRNGPEECRSAVRFASSETTRSDTMGFRVVVEPRQ